MAIVDIAPRTPAQEKATHTHEIAAPFLRAADNIDPSIPEAHRTGIVMLACGISYRLVALELDVDVHTILRWRRQYSREVDDLRPVVQRIASELVGGLVGDLVAVALTAIPGLAAKARAGLIDEKGMQALAQASRQLSELAEKLGSAQSVRPSFQNTLTRERALRAIAALEA